jgi:hypothetical protein
MITLVTILAASLPSDGGPKALDFDVKALFKENGMDGMNFF